MRVIKTILTKKTVIAAVLSAVLVAGFFISEPGKMMVASAIKRDLPIFCVQKDYKVCSFSFDIISGKQNIDAVIKALDKYNIKATFYVTGEWADKNQSSVVKLSKANHEIMNRSNTNPHMTQLTTEEILTEINATNQKIEKITGAKPILFRPPYGEYDDKVISTIRSMGMMTTLWDCDSLDNQRLSAGKISQRVMKTVKPGSIVLFHSTSGKTVDALPTIIEGLLKEGYEFTPVSQLIYQDDFVIDSAGRQIPVCK